MNKRNMRQLRRLMFLKRKKLRSPEEELEMLVREQCADECGKYAVTTPALLQVNRV